MSAPEMHNPFRQKREGSQPKRPEGVSPREIGRLYFIGGLLVFCLVAMVLTRYFMKTQEPKAPANPAATPGPGIGISPTPPLPPTPPAPGQQDPQRAVQGRSIEELVATFSDDKDTVKQPIQTGSPEFLGLLNAVRTTLAPEELARRVTGTRAEQLLKDPAAHRGKAVRVYGRLIKLTPEMLPTTPDSTATHVYVGYMLSHPEMTRVHFYLPEKPAGEFKTKVVRGALLYEDYVEVEGFFLRLYTYEGDAPDGGVGAIQTAAVLLAKNLRIVPPMKVPDARGAFMAIAFTLGGIIAIIAIVAGVMSRHSSGSFRLKILEERRKRAAAEGRSLFPASTRKTDEPKPGS